MRKFLFAAVTFLLLSGWLAIVAAPALSPVEELGSLLYFDEALSEPTGQSCSSCHLPEAGFADPDANLPVSEGVIPGLFGGRNSPISAYAMYAPILHFDADEELWIGGQFWDGRATGEVLGDPLADQALGPFQNPVEMANISKDQVIADIAVSSYAGLFEQVWGPGSLANVEAAYDQVALSIAAFERTQIFGQFSSRYDTYLAACLDAGGGMEDCAEGEGKIARKTGKKMFTNVELRGFQLFVGENDNNGKLMKREGAACAECHIAEWTEAADYGLPVQVPAWAPAGMVPPIFTDFTYDNLGLPVNTEFPIGPSPSLDFGLGTVTGDPDDNGKFKVMPVRNIGLSAPYAHNGLFKSLKEIVHFYNTRDVPGALPQGQDWPAPQYPATMNTDELGNLGLSDADEDALVAFMKTLSDG
jgi:cytochrome c peroxidase